MTSRERWLADSISGQREMGTRFAKRRRSYFGRIKEMKMKNGTVKISCALAALALVVTAGLSGCGANSDDANSATQQSSASGQNNEAGRKSVVKTPDLSKISWNVDPAAEGNTPRLALSYTNGLDVDLLEFKVSYSLKNEVTDDQLQSLFGGDDWTTPEDVRDRGLSCDAIKYVAVGESGMEYCTVGAFKTSVTNQMDLWNVAQINAEYYDSNNKTIQKIQYFPSNKRTIKEGPATAAFKWVAGKHASMVPKPDVPIVKNMNDSDDSLYFYAYSADSNMMQNYVSQCEQMGWQIESQTEYFTHFATKDGYELTVQQNDCMSVSLSKED